MTAKAKHPSHSSADREGVPEAAWCPEGVSAPFGSLLRPGATLSLRTGRALTGVLTLRSAREARTREEKDDIQEHNDSTSWEGIEDLGTGTLIDPHLTNPSGTTSRPRRPPGRPVLVSTRTSAWASRPPRRPSRVGLVAVPSRERSASCCDRGGTGCLSQAALPVTKRGLCHPLATLGGAYHSPSPSL